MSECAYMYLPKPKMGPTTAQDLECMSRRILTPTHVMVDLLL